MKKKHLITVAALIILGILAAILFWPQSQPQLKHEPVQVAAPPAPPPAPEVRQEIAAPPAPQPLPLLAESDSFMLEALAELINNKSLMQLFLTDRIIRNIVATIDNLPRKRVSMSVIPVKRVLGKFIVSGDEDNLIISTKNAARYKPYVKIAEATDAKKLVELYVRIYPLFQQAYEDLGYPKQYFNDRLIVVLDDLLAAPDIKEPVRLVQPVVYYQFADPDLERRSIGQRILMRTGSTSEAIIKGKLREIRQELMRHVRVKKANGGG